MTDDNRRCGFVAVIGAPNVGKSTLINRMVGTKVTIVSPKAQTTRTRVLGIVIAGASQVVLVDTPGIFRPRRRLDRAMVAAAWDGAGDADQICLLVDAAKGVGPQTQTIIDRLAASDRQVLLVLNKVDLVRKPALLSLAASLTDVSSQSASVFADVFMISAETGDGVSDLTTQLAASMPAGPWLYPEDEVSDLPNRLLAAEITREKLYLNLQQELPYATTVETENWTEKEDGSVRIDQVIYVERPGQKAIVLGKGGSTIKKIGAAARHELESLLERRVHVFLFVKVRQDWGDDPDRYRAIGLDFDA